MNSAKVKVNQSSGRHVPRPEIRALPFAAAEGPWVFPLERGGTHAQQVARIREPLQHALTRDGFAVVRTRPLCGSLAEFRALCIELAIVFGEPVRQNQAGDTVIEVYDRRIGRIIDGVRYHQTRQGGDIHTDSVNEPRPFQHLLLGCASAAQVGGETIVLRARDVAAELEKLDGVLDTLSRPFWFDGRGMSQGCFQAPIHAVVEQRHHFRYLRPYIERGHAVRTTPLSEQELFALDTLDAVLETGCLQSRFMLEPGDVLVCLDTEVFHGRTSFIDGPTPDGWAPHRLMLRLWTRR
ncbi:hypothetical protein WJ63_15150 [Burkholderia pyrrocinia]|uniref:TauD/TfdA family dioxygenase n=1 Tax=Burkholderia stagnalis TaxID=1503054 RepID=UPI000367E046|nr:TauD/TfdA family dioxygenase [Burkholderia stagnalis]KVN25990.1 hypothetical protein WJ63_15150 [Burkholderia pyrrocinia]WGS44513.1 TauD/TfdA family dioxygenase [Burkholderia sp. JSH-S8]